MSEQKIQRYDMRIIDGELTECATDDGMWVRHNTMLVVVRDTRVADAEKIRTLEAQAVEDAATIKTLRDSIHDAIVMIEDDDNSRNDRAGLSILRNVLFTTAPQEPTK